MQRILLETILPLVSRWLLLFERRRDLLLSTATLDFERGGRHRLRFGQQYPPLKKVVHGQVNGREENPSRHSSRRYALEKTAHPSLLDSFVEAVERSLVKIAVHHELCLDQVERVNKGAHD